MDVAEDVKVNTVEGCDGGAGVVRVAYGSRREAEEESVGFLGVCIARLGEKEHMWGPRVSRGKVGVRCKLFASFGSSGR
jgi:hypothetical protein